MEVEEMKVFRFAMGVTRKNKIRNKYIRGTVKVKRFGMKMMEGRLRWYGHVMRRDQKYIGKRVMEMELAGKRKRGRPRRRFLDVVKEDMGTLVQGRRTLKTGRFAETSYAVANPDQRERPKKEEEEEEGRKENSNITNNLLNLAFKQNEFK